MDENQLARGISKGFFSILWTLIKYIILGVIVWWTLLIVILFVGVSNQQQPKTQYERELEHWKQLQQEQPVIPDD
jgi:heme/copper-type cytochrome/quinol oxidase subunit 2